MTFYKDQDKFGLRLRGESWVKALHQLCDDFLSAATIVVEIGCFAGESTVVFAEHCLKVFAIDPWEEVYLNEMCLGCNDPEIQQLAKGFASCSMAEIECFFDQRVSAFKSKVEKIRDYSGNQVDHFSPNSVDFVYIDAIHTYEAVEETIREWRPKVKVNGYIGGHDYCDRTWPGVVRAVQAQLGYPLKVYNDTSWITRVYK